MEEVWGVGLEATDRRVGFALVGFLGYRLNQPFIDLDRCFFMDKKLTGLTFQQKTVLATLQKHTQFIDEAIITIENKAQQNFTIVNIVAAIAGAVNISSLSPSEIAQAIQSNPYFLLIYSPSILLAISYCATVFFSMQAMSLAVHGSHPILVTEEEVMRWEKYPISAFYKWTKLAYIEIYKENKCVSEKKAKSVHYSRRCISVAVSALFIQAVFCVGAIVLAEMGA